MELVIVAAPTVAGFNLTIVECKLLIEASGKRKPKSFNLTIVECTVSPFVAVALGANVLISP